jgi:hypothetical protein
MSRTINLLIFFLEQAGATAPLVPSGSVPNSEYNEPAYIGHHTLSFLRCYENLLVSIVHPSAIHPTAGSCVANGYASH